MGKITKIAIVGGGPAALFMFKRLVESGLNGIQVTVFERKQMLGAGMPYSADGANTEHVTNVSDNEIPQIMCSVEQWLEMAPSGTLERFAIHKENFNEFKVLPRLFFGEYLSSQFEMLYQKANGLGIATILRRGCNVLDIAIDREAGQVAVVTQDGQHETFGKVIICTGHHWPRKSEGRVPGYFDSPYPPSKLAGIVNKAVAIRGSSLTAIDAIRTLARQNGAFTKGEDGKVSFGKFPEADDFKITMHSRNGLLPAVRFHLDDSHLKSGHILSKKEILKYRDGHDGFVSLDYIFDHNFKEIIRIKDAVFYEKIKDLTMEGFVAMVMDLRDRLDPFTLLRAEYKEAEKSIRNHQSIYWKEALAILSASMNFPAKYFAAEDMIRLQKTLMPLISVVIAFIPQKSCEELLALRDAGVLDIVAVGSESEILPNRAGGITYRYTCEGGAEQSDDYEVFIDCIGQPHLSFEDFPFASMKASQSVTPARLRFASKLAGRQEQANGNQNVTLDGSGDYYLTVSGVAINDNFQVTDQYGAYNENIFLMAVPYIGGYNPDYSGLDFCEEASGRIVRAMKKGWDV